MCSPFRGSILPPPFPRPRPLPSPYSLDMLLSAPVSSEEFRVASIRFSCLPACVLPPLLPLCRPFSCYLLVSYDAFLSDVLLRTGDRPGRLHSLAIYRPSPCSYASCPFSHRSGCPAPPFPPPPPHPLFLRDPVPFG